MELRHLRYFVTVAEEQNVTRAAARLNVSQPPLSRQIRDLEEELGVALFEHGAKSIRLTEAGRVFLPEAQAVLQRAGEAVRTVKAVAAGGQGELHVGYAPSLTVEILPRALREFQDALPGVKVVLHDLSTAEMLAGLREQSLHVALIVQVPPRVLRPLKFEPLQRYGVRVAAATTHPLARRRAVSLAHAASERLITYSRAEYPEYHEWLEELFAPRKPQVAEEHDSVTSLIAAVEAGRGIALVAECVACLAGPRLKLRPLAPAPPRFVVGIARSPGALSAAAERFVAAARSR